jgi:hypothetical protein
MQTIADKLQALAEENPYLHQAEAARRVGCSKETVRVKCAALGLPFSKAGPRRHVIAVYNEGVKSIREICKRTGLSSDYVYQILRAARLPIPKHDLRCEWCGIPFETTIRKARHCSKRCQRSHRTHLRVVDREGNKPCLRCGVKRAVSPWRTCPGFKRHQFVVPSRPIPPFGRRRSPEAAAVRAGLRGRDEPTSSGKGVVSQEGGLPASGDRVAEAHRVKPSGPRRLPFRRPDEGQRDPHPRVDEASSSETGPVRSAERPSAQTATAILEQQECTCGDACPACKGRLNQDCSCWDQGYEDAKL